MESPDVLIVGGGPAGIATALGLADAAPALAARTLVVEKRRHPRHKVCAGGLIPHVLDRLRELEIPLDVPHVVVRRAAVQVPRHEVGYEDGELCAVVRRAEFDALLASVARRRGVEIREDEKLIEVAREAGRLRVVTTRGEYRTKVLVGADGSGSAVRRALFDPVPEAIGRAVMCDLDAVSIGWDGVERRRYLFDFRAVPSGLKGYEWEFPCWIDGRPHVNLGAYALDRGRTGTSLPALARRRAEALGAAAIRLEAFPIRWYDPGSPISTEGALLVGDAAGCDPLMGEGISYAFEYGRLASDEIVSSFARSDFRFAEFSQRVRRSWFGRKLRRLRTAARVFYGPAGAVAFEIAARSRTLQDVGIRWYNGVDGWDRQSGWRVAGRALGQALRA